MLCEGLHHHDHDSTSQGPEFCGKAILGVAHSKKKKLTAEQVK